MDLEYFRKVLSAKEQELIAEITRLEGEARESPVAEVGDWVDEATSDEGASNAYEESAVVSETLAQVRAALQRIDDGTYGRCVDCGRWISLARLEAVPWTPYCIDDQQKHDAEKGVRESTL